MQLVCLGGGSVYASSRGGVAIDRGAEGSCQLAVQLMALAAHCLVFCLFMTTLKHAPTWSDTVSGSLVWAAPEWVKASIAAVVVIAKKIRAIMWWGITCRSHKLQPAY